MNWHLLRTEEIFELFGSGKNGLTSDVAEERIAESGYNELIEKKKKTAAGIFFSQFKDFMILILLGAALISGIAGDLTDTIVILIIVLVNAFIGFIQEYRADKAMQLLKHMTIVQSKVVRNGIKDLINSRELVPGDIVFLEAGDAVPADMRIIESSGLKVDESSLTGESHSIDKITNPLQAGGISIGDRINMSYKGTFVTQGRGAGIVTETGMQTQLGLIAKMLQEKEVITPLQRRMILFGRNLSFLNLALCALFFLAGWLRGLPVMQMALTSISLAVAAIPEALPAVITISLALAAKRMVRFHTLIRKLPTVETLGSVTYICTDKTGTLTKNKMKVEHVFTNNGLYNRDSLINAKDDKDLDLLLQAFALNNDSVSDPNNKLKGDGTEIALMETALEVNSSFEKYTRVAEIPFDSSRKLMTTFHQSGSQIIQVTKGAPDLLISKCSSGEKKILLAQVDAMAETGQRVLGFAYRYIKDLPQNPDPWQYEKDLTFLGLAGIIDPPREEVSAAVEQCRKAGITAVMITGDHPLTARNIAERIGLLKKEKDLVVTGEQLASMDTESFAGIVEKIKVYARVSPEQKLQIVKMLQQKGHYVAMTGDGVNDAPSLKRANIGIAMGITGTDVSKEAAHMILLDDNFSTIVRAIKEGRRIYDNILKFIKYLMTTNAGELWTLLLGPFFGLPIALLPIHILWINLISDGLPALSLSFEKAEKDIMNRPPRPPRESVFSEGRGFHMIWVGLLMAGIALTAQSWAIKNNLHWQTLVFNILCISQMAHLLAIRSDRRSLFSIGPFSNKPMLFAVALTLGLQYVVTFIPLFQPIFKTEALTLTEFVIVGAAALLVFSAVEMEKWFFSMKKNAPFKRNG